MTHWQRIKSSMKFTFTKKQAILVVVIGIALGIIVATIMTTLDWRLNPSGIFHNEQGTHWEVVFETAFSWFLPVTMAASAATAILLFLFWRAK